MSDTTYDVAIVGGGPAGLTAAIWLARYLRSVVVIDAGDPRNWETRGVHGFLGLEGIRPAELRARGRDTAEQYGACFIDATVSCVDKESDDRFRITLSKGLSITSQRLLLAIGLRDVWPDVPGLERVYGDSAHVCPDCDGYETRGKKTVVIASGRKAVGMALALTTWTSEVVICTNGRPADIDAANLAKLDALNIPVLETRITCLKSVDGKARSLDLEGDMCLDCQQIFFALGQEPADDLVAQLGCKRDEIGRAITDAHFHTSVHNVYAAGDIIHAPEIAIGAAASGAVAALAIHHSLLPPGRTLE